MKGCCEIIYRKRLKKLLREAKEFLARRKKHQFAVIYKIYRSHIYWKFRYQRMQLTCNIKYFPRLVLRFVGDFCRRKRHFRKSYPIRPLYKVCPRCKFSEAEMKRYYNYHSTKLDFRFCAGSYTARGVSGTSDKDSRWKCTLFL